MVPIITSRITYSRAPGFNRIKCNASAFFLLIPCLLQAAFWKAEFWNDALSDMKSAAQEVDTAFQKAGKAIGDRFKDTKLTRAIDYGARKGAFELAERTAQAVLSASKEAADGTLMVGAKTAEAALSTAERFLADVVQAASPAILRGSANAAQEVIEAAKQAGVATLKGTQVVISTLMDTFDIRKLSYRGDLKRLENGVFGDVSCEGRIFGKDFSTQFDLDPRSIPKILNSLEPLFIKLGNLLDEKIGAPFREAFEPLKQQSERAASMVKKSPTEADRLVAQAIQAAQKSDVTINAIKEEEYKAARTLVDATTKLRDIAQKTNKELEAAIRKGVKESSADTALARQEYVKRLKNKQ
jgi:hypothetical protein